MRDWAAICEVWKDAGYEALSAEERVFFNIRVLIDSIENGGAISYFYNSGADHVEDCMEALDQLKAGEFKSQFQRVLELFPPEAVQDFDARNRVINSWEDADAAIDDLLEEVDDRLFQLTADLESKLSTFCGGPSGPEAAPGNRRVANDEKG